MVTDNRPSGWYRDPSGRPDTLRWWTGTSWTDDYRAQSDFVQPSGADAPGTPHEPPPAGPQPGFAVQETVSSRPTVSAGAPSWTPTADVGASAPWPGSDRPIPQPVASVQFEAVEPNRVKKRVIISIVTVIVAVVTGIGGYLIGTSGDDDGGGGASSASGSPSGSPSVLPNDVMSPEGFAGTPLLGGTPIDGGQVVTGPKGKMTFSVPAGWTPQVNPKATSEEARFVLDPYQCTGRVDNMCARGFVVQNLRLLSGGWSDLPSLTLGMGQELISAQGGGSAPPGVTGPVKHKPITLQGHDGYLALWDLPMLAGKTAPSSYCGVLTVRTAANSPEIAVLQICLDRTSEAPQASLMDRIANSIAMQP